MASMNLPAHPEIRDLGEIRDRLVEWVNAQEAGSTADLEIDIADATQPALQLLIAAAAALADRSVTCAPGPHAGAVLASLVAEEKEA